MAVKQLVLPFQIRNPYRLDRPYFDPSEVRQSVIEEEELRRLQSLPQRPLPPEPAVVKKSTVLGRSSEGGAYTGVHPKRGSRDEIYQHRKMTKPKLNDVASPEPLQQASAYSSHGQQPTLNPVPAIRSLPRRMYVEAAASKFSSWVNFEKIPAGETRLDSLTSPIGSSLSNKTQESKTIKSRKRENNQVQEAAGDPCYEGGMVTGRIEGSFSARTPEPVSNTDDRVESITGYVLVGSVEEQAQYPRH
ncbi:hypothetical protein BGX34_009346 [Mortierella sp. NVP85]|nr:hypothetical protein BGX34_009346 [Mortierella sp. NVP85]